MVNVHIHQFKPGGAVVDAAALAQFQQQWATYRKLVESDCLSHREVGGILRGTLNEVFKRPFSFLDIACGDASAMKAALAGTKVHHYHGIDLSQAALELAAGDRPAWLDRCLRTNKPLWSVLTNAEWDQIWAHVTACDFPETAAVWCELGRNAGFAEARQVFVDPTDFFRLFRYQA